MKDISEERKEELLGMVQAECARAIGFDNVGSGELTEQREKALLYYKGEMPDLVMQLRGRSKVVSTDVADAIETAMPDLIDIFTGGDDVVSFEPVGEDDVEAAQQETDYLHHVVFNKNQGWKVVYEAFKDALMCKTGVFSWRWEGEYEPQAEHHEGKTLIDLQRAMQEGVVDDLMVGEPDSNGIPTWSYEFTPKNAQGRIVIEAIAPENLAVAPDTRTIKDTTYACVKSYPRAQDLLAMGFDPEIIDMLPPWNESGTTPERQARDTVDESQFTGTTVQALRQVEVYCHYLKVYEPDEKKYCLYKILTGGAGYAGILIDIEEVSRIQLACITPYMNPHRFYGDSIADKLMEIQKIKSSLMRMSLDNGYFALNQRFEVAVNGANENTIDDLLNNEPGMPIRVNTPGTINPVSSGGLNYNPLEHLEYFSTVSEQRTGIVRNAQGLNPDTLHDTKGGLEILANSAMKRLRMIARTFAETGYKDFLVGLHATMREIGSSIQDTVRLRGKEFVPIDPSTWRQRDDMVIQVGVGAGGREHNMIVGQQIGAIQAQLVEGQMMPDGPLVNKENMYNAALYAIKSLGVKAPEQFITDPKTFQPPEPQPDPKVIADAEKAKAEQQRLQIDQQRLELEAQKAMADEQFKRDQLAEQTRLKELEIETRDTFDRDKLAAEVELDQSQFEARLTFERETLAVNTALKKETEASAPPTNTQVGGDDL